MWTSKLDFFIWTRTAVPEEHQFWTKFWFFHVDQHCCLWRTRQVDCTNFVCQIFSGGFLEDFLENFCLIPFHWICFWSAWRPYLILVSTASTGGGGLFSSRRTFFHREHERYCFRKVYSGNITHKIPYTPNKKTKYANQKPSTPTKIPCRQTKRLSMINKTRIMPRKKLSVRIIGNLSACH